MKIDTSKKFDMNVQPPEPSKVLLPIEWIIAFFFAPPWRASIKKVNCEDLKPPYFLISNHACMRDFAMAVYAMFPHRAYWLISVEEFAGREKLLRAIGGIGKRKFTLQLPVVKHCMQALMKKKITVSIYPEARYSIAGINERLDGALGKLAKKANVPVVLFMQHGNFLSSPQWNKSPSRAVKSQGEFIQLVSREEVQALSAEEIQERIEKKFVYDEYAWQRDNKITISSKYRAHNIHRILYQCPACKKEFTTQSEYTKIWCTSCDATWEMDVYGQLKRLDSIDNIFTHVPDWYRWERSNVYEEVNSGNYHFEDTARLEHLVSSRAKFKEIGTVKLVHDYNGFTVTGKLNDGSDFELNRAPQSMISCHIEYNFKNRGDALDLATVDETYWVFPLNAINVLTKLHFAAEALHDLSLKE